MSMVVHPPTTMVRSPHWPYACLALVSIAALPVAAAFFFVGVTLAAAGCFVGACSRRARTHALGMRMLATGCALLAGPLAFVAGYFGLFLIVH